MKFSTKAIHVGQSPDPATGATITPRGIINANYKDAYWETCPADKRH